MAPGAGSVFAYAGQALGPSLGFLAGWLLRLDCLLVPALVLGNLMPAVKLDDPAMAIFSLAAQLFGPTAMAQVAIVLIWVVGFTHALPMLAGVARLLFAMARDARLPAVLARLHPTRQVPHVALLATTVVCFGVAWVFLDQPALLTEIVNFGALGAFAFLHLSVLAMWRRAPVQARGAWHGLALSALIGLALTLAILSQLQPKAQAAGLVWLAVGVVAAWRAKASPRTS